MCESKPRVLIIDSNLKTNLLENATKQPSYVRANLMCSKQTSHPIFHVCGVLRLFYRFSTHMAQLETPRSQYRPHILGADTPDITDTPGTPSYSSALSTRRCHHPSVRCWRRVQDTALLSHPRTQRGVTVASCGARCDRPSASRARM